MTERPSLFATAAFALLLLVAPAAPAAEFQDLFNGKDLTGWKGHKALWSVVDGTILGRTTQENPTKGNTFLIWQGGEVSDFEFTCEVQFEGNNSGVQYRSQVVDAEQFVLSGYQADLHPRQEYFGMLYGEKLGKRGIIATREQRIVVDENREKRVIEESKPGTTLDGTAWNTLRIVAVGDRLIHQVNGVTTVDITDRHPDLSSDSGVLGLQLHAGPPMTVRFRKLKLRHLDGEEAATTLKTAIEEGKPKAQNATVAPNAAAPSSEVRKYEWVAAKPRPHWLWTEGKADNDPLFLRHTFSLSGKPTKTRLYATCDNEAEIWINGESAGRAPDWGAPVMRDDIAGMLKQGENTIAVRAKNRGGTAAFVFKLVAETRGAEPVTITSTPAWKASRSDAKGWKSTGFDDSGWTVPLLDRGAFGVQPWGLAGIDGPTGGKRNAKKSPLDPSEIAVPEGFRVELLYTVPRDEQGSWVALTRLPDGRLIASDQYDAGIYEIAVSESSEGPRVSVEKIPAGISGAWGMHWHRDSLYANVIGKTLKRIFDSTGDGRLDAIEELPGAPGNGEHGNHAVIPYQDGKHLMVIGGNSTPMLDHEISRVTGWDEDLLLPRQWDARGHARGRLAPGGYATLFDTEEKTHEVYTTGFRNQYDIAANKHGDVFTFDADMEWDMGMPWYRPTRICLVASGADYGWRSGTGKWPSYYEDSLPPVVDIGPGSPTGVVSGLETAFPAPYRDAIYALDWTFGTIYAIHLEEIGAGYRGEAEPFVTGAPLPVTDAIAGSDGALYFTIGGRRTQSALYRVTATGETPKRAAPQSSDSARVAAADARETRRALEAFHGRTHPDAIATAWPHLASEDRFLRHAARVAIESQPVEQWAHRVLSSDDPQTVITGGVALARQGAAEAHQGVLTEALLGLDPSTLTDSQLLGLLRAYALDFIRLGRPGDEQRRAVIAELDPLFPHENADVNTELVRVLVYLEAPGVIGKTMDLITNRGKTEVPAWRELASRNEGYGARIRDMLENHPPSREIGYAFMLRNLKTGWTLDQRRQYFTFLNEAAQFAGGASYAGFLENLRDEALGNCTNEERAALAGVTGENFNPVPDFDILPPAGPGRIWTMEEAAQHVARGNLRKAGFERGRSLYHAIGCAACHRVGGLGGDIGPDLTSVPNKFDETYVLESLIDPSAQISDQYGSSAVTKGDGTVVTGLVVEREEGAVDVYPPNADAEPVHIAGADISSIEPVPVSQMPPGLINLLNPEELRDLMAYLMAGGDPEAKVYGN